MAQRHAYISGFLAQHLRASGPARMVAGMIASHKFPARPLRLALVLGLALLPMGCGSSGFDPIGWAHNQEGGEIAKDRPPMPLSDAPYPNLATVPPAPPPPDAKARAAIASALVADRANAQYAMTREPVASAPSPIAPPVQPAPLENRDDMAGSTLQTAHVAPRPAPPPVATAGPSAGPSAGPKPQQVASTAPAMSGAEKLRQPMAQGRPAEPLSSLPTLADAPPAPARLAGVKASTAPTPPPVAPAGFVPPAPIAAAKASASPATPSAPPPETAVPTIPRTQSTSKGVRIGFAPGSSTLPGEALAALKVFAHERGVHSMIVTGYGDVTNTDAKAQAEGLSLALARARVVAAYLGAVGVPPSSMRVTAEALGQGAAVRLVE